ncbi:MAG: asparaginase [Methylobacterium sp.]|nr:asparaginase [Methylobacterium sp.]MCA3603333.1 asparaginase [Methylobacterium sp.]MCA3614167.1 asparaginase [Methylobacterium sp.]MCA4908926.1 asparaginase [Methylobacterium sp.]
MSNPLLVEITRGGIVESGHTGAFAVVDADGSLVLSMGDIARPIFPRSAVKGFQALPLIESGAADRLHLTDAELALACASHSGEEEHTKTAAAMLAKAGRDETCLECGAHWPMLNQRARDAKGPDGDRALQALVASGLRPTALHNNCSGKHAGFVCLAIATGHDPKGYIQPGHPTMREITAALSAMTGHDLSKAAMGIDGCSIPTYAIPLRSLAAGFAKFASGAGLSPGRAQAARRLRQAVAASPFHVAGTGRFDTVVMEDLRERAFIKTGAEGVYCGALPELGYGIALKIDDGATRASETVMAALLTRLLELGKEAKVVTERLDHQMKNWNGLEVGRMRSIAALRG